NLENELKGLNFFRCHKSYIINLEKIQSLTRNTIYINNNGIPVSKYRVKNLRDRLADILGDIIC
ncbi:TPA: LytTR family transcriptional regulator DNA-binding domain-containing protein, partial [Clostridioides difficile]